MTGKSDTSLVAHFMFHICWYYFKILLRKKNCEWIRLWKKKLIKVTVPIIDTIRLFPYSKDGLSWGGNLRIKSTWDDLQ